MILRTIADRRNGHQVGPILVHNPRSLAAEAFRTLRTNLQFSGLERHPRLVLVTSAGDGEGKTTVVANLGAALAESGKRVLLVDGDLRRPALHAAFGLPEAPGLTNTLLADEFDPRSLPTSVPNLALLPVGTLPPNPAEFIASERLGRLLARLAERYDHVLVDSPPVGLVADAAVLAPSVDGVLLVVCAGRTRRELARRAKEQLENVNARILGVVLNKAKPDRSLKDYQAIAR